MDTHLEYFNWVLFQGIMNDWSIEDYFNKGRVLCEYIMSIISRSNRVQFDGVLFQWRKDIVWVQGEYFILLIIQYMWLKYSFEII